MSEAHCHEWDEEFRCTICDRNAIWAYEQAEAERDELRTALRDLRAWMMTPGSVEQWAALRVRVGALIGPVSPPDGRSGPEGG